MSTPARTSFVGIEARIFGMPVLLASDSGKIVAVEVASIERSIPGSADLSGYLRNRRFTGTLTVDGLPRTTYLVSREDFHTYCQLNSTPQLDAYRKELARIIMSVEDRGSYIDPNAGPSAYIPPGLENNKTAQMLAALLHQEAQMAQLGHEITEVKGEVADVRGQLANVQQQLGYGRGWTVAGWFSQHGIKAVNEIINQEGMNLSRICRGLGIATPEDEQGRPLKVCNGGTFPARVWPREAIDHWWPGCCARRGWQLEWRA